VLVYTASRLGLFLGCLIVGWLIGFRGGLLLLVALVVSGGLSLFVLQDQRIAMSGAVERAVNRGRSRARARTEAEDAYVDQLNAESDRRAG
jgi:hypothetical protein